MPLGYLLFPVMMLVYLQMAYLRRRTIAARVLFVGGFAAINLFGDVGDMRVCSRD